MEINEVIASGFSDLQAKLDAKMAEHDAEMKKNGKLSTELTGQIDTLASQLKEMGDEITDIARKGTPAKGSESVSRKSLGAQFTGGEGFKSFSAEDRNAKTSLVVKNTSISTGLDALLSDSTTTADDQRPGIIPGVMKPITLRQLIPTIPTSSIAVVSHREVGFTNNAAETAQGAAKPYSVGEFERRTIPIQTVPHLYKLSTQLMSDAPAVAAYIDMRMIRGVDERVDYQLLLGNGTDPNLSGYTDAGNFTAYTPASTGDNLAVAINRAKYQLWNSGVMATVAVVNPGDWSEYELSKETSGAFLFGTPGTAAGMSPFGVQIVLSANMPAGSFLVGDIAGSSLVHDRMSTTVEMGYVNDDFERNLITLRAEARLALSVDRPFGIMYGLIKAAA